jgi:hypothetical protein
LKTLCTSEENFSSLNGFKGNKKSLAFFLSVGFCVYVVVETPEVIHKAKSISKLFLKVCSTLFPAPRTWFTNSSYHLFLFNLSHKYCLELKPDMNMTHAIK